MQNHFFLFCTARCRAHELSLRPISDNVRLSDVDPKGQCAEARPVAHNCFSCPCAIRKKRAKAREGLVPDRLRLTDCYAPFDFTYCSSIYQNLPPNPKLIELV